MAELYAILDANQFEANATGVSVPDGPAVQANTLAIAALPAGRYELHFGAEFQMPDLNNALTNTFSSPGGHFTTFAETKEQKDINDQTAWDYSFVVDHPGGAFDMLHMAQVTPGGNTATIFFANLRVTRVA